MYHFLHMVSNCPLWKYGGRHPAQATWQPGPWGWSTPGLSQTKRNYVNLKVNLKEVAC